MSDEPTVSYRILMHLRPCDRTRGNFTIIAQRQRRRCEYRADAHRGKEAVDCTAGLPPKGLSPDSGTTSRTLRARRFEKVPLWFKTKARRAGSPRRGTHVTQQSKSSRAPTKPPFLPLTLPTRGDGVKLKQRETTRHTAQVGMSEGQEGRRVKRGAARDGFIVRRISSWGDARVRKTTEMAES